MEVKENENENSGRTLDSGVKDISALPYSYERADHVLLFSVA